METGVTLRFLPSLTQRQHRQIHGQPRTVEACSVLRALARTQAMGLSSATPLPIALAAAAFVLAGAGVAPAGTQDLACDAPGAVWAPLPDELRIGVSAGRPWTIVALGSSSTQGIGASDPRLTYPAQLEQLLLSRLPGRRVVVVNKGIGGETVADNLLRLDRDVLALQPDLVIWQVGTNDALRGLEPATVRDEIVAGVARLRAAGSRVVLMDPQPLEPAPSDLAAMAEAVHDAARQSGAGLLPRGALMRYWIDSGAMAAADLIGGDHLHMTDTGYRCLAERVADVLAGDGGMAAISAPAVAP
jgi:lysophospholipase L1-like esterase